MVPHVSLRSEALAAALRAGEWPLVLVNPDVDVEILLFTEGLAAPWEVTLEGLRAIVQVHMGIQANLATEGLLTTVMRANECLIASALGFSSGVRCGINLPLLVGVLFILTRRAVHRTGALPVAGGLLRGPLSKDYRSCLSRGFLPNSIYRSWFRGDLRSLLGGLRSLLGRRCLMLHWLLISGRNPPLRRGHARLKNLLLGLNDTLS